MKKDYDLQEMEVKISQVENDSLREKISKISTKSSLGLEILKHILSIQIPHYNKYGLEHGKMKMRRILFQNSRKD